ncbi:MAG: hypothetical protein K5920_06185 [Bacteroidales bacterium]|nr:hypothetical protein [Bacteroidales bacterium]
MIELNENFSLADLGNVRKDSFEIMYNKNRASSWEGTMYITPDKIYYLVAPASMAGKSVFDIGGAPKSWCIDLSEIASYGKFGLGGFKIELKDGNVLRFANVFRKMRNRIVEALEERLNK